MPRRSPDNELQAIADIVSRHADGIGVAAIHAAFDSSLNRRTLNRRIAALLRQGRIQRRGAGPSARYVSVQRSGSAIGLISAQFPVPDGEVTIPISPASQEIRDYLARPVANRRPVGYDRSLLDDYEPNKTQYLPPELKMHLRRIGKPIATDRPAGTFARDLDRFIQMVHSDFSHLHEGNIARYRLRLPDFESWKRATSA